MYIIYPIETFTNGKKFTLTEYYNLFHVGNKCDPSIGKFLGDTIDHGENQQKLFNDNIFLLHCGYDSLGNQITKPISFERSTANVKIRYATHMPLVSEIINDFRIIPINFDNPDCQQFIHFAQTLIEEQELYLNYQKQ